MIPAELGYVRPGSIEEALELLARSGTTAIAGGQSLLPLLKLRLAEPGTLVDIARLPDLRGIREGEDGALAIGAATTWSELLESPLVARHAPLLATVVRDIGDLQVRNRGTVGGSLAHADPASDLAAAALALDATIALRGPAGRRVGPANGFFRGPFETARRPGELIVELRIPALPAGTAGAWRAIAQPASGFSIAGVAAVIGTDAGRIVHARIAITGVADAPYRATGVEERLLGGDGSPEAIAAAAAAATEGRTVNADPHADAAYRATVATVLVRRAVGAALGRDLG